jgi:cell division protein FtsN
MINNTNHLQAQRGGTTLGIIVGVVLGLLVALGVSLYIANSGGPVTNKAANTAARIEPPADPSKAPDPNQSLYTKVPKADEAKDSKDDQDKKETKAGKDTATDAKVSAPIATPATPTTVATPASKSAEQDGIGKIAAIVTPAKPAPAPVVTAAPAVVAVPSTAAKAGDTIVMPKPANAAAGERYFVQAGAFANVNEANALKAKIALLGVDMTLSPREKDGQILLRVRTAPLAAVDAERLRNTLKANAIETSLVKVQ